MPRAAAGAWTSGGVIYLAGGIDLEGFPSAEKLNIGVGGWTEMTSVSTDRCCFASVELDGFLFAIGGRSLKAGVLASVERFDPSSGAWVEVSPMPTARWNLMAAVVDGRIFAIGGIAGTGDDSRTLDVVEMYDPENDSWTSLRSAPIRRSGAAALEFQDQVFIIGGRPEVSSKSV